MPVILSDIHFHNWAACSKTLPDGLNSRLNDTIQATRQAFDFALKNDKVVLFGGDLVHTRGSLIPSVFNQITKLWKEYEEKGLEFFMVAGNHDAEDINAIAGRTALDSLKSDKCHVITNQPASFVLPDGSRLWAYGWIDDIDTLESLLFQHNEEYGPNDIVLIHAPINGFIPHISKGLDPEKLTKLNCKYVFAGHIHKFGCYKNKIYSIGSLTQQNFGDAGKQLGFLYLGKNGFVQQIETNAPHFLDLNNIAKVDGSLSFAKEVQKSFVRVTLENVTEEEKRRIEKELKALKPLHLDVRFTPKTVSARKEVLATSKLTSQEVTVKYIEKQPFNYLEETKQAALKILEDMGQNNDE